ncbi:MAG: hypothetical protein ACXVE5_11355 [Gaiellaceae bacterium]
MPLALITTGLAGRRAGPDHCPEDREIRRGLTDRDSGGRAAGVGAVEAEANAAHHLVHIVLREIGVGATRAAGRAVEALVDTAQKGVVIDTCRLWMRLDYVSNRHVLSSLGRAMNTIWKLPPSVFGR